MLRISDIDHCGQLEPEPCWVYALVDPRTEEIRYIGCSRSVKERTRAHLNGFSGSRTVGAWKNELKKLNLQPLIFLVEMTTDSERVSAETRWIQACLTQGANLLNVIYRKSTQTRKEAK